MKITKQVTEWVVFVGLFLVPFIAFIVPDGMFFPFISGKGFAFRILIELVFGTYLLLALIEPKYRPKFSWITKAVLAFTLVMLVSDLLGANVYKSLWSNYERMEGFVLIFHLALYYIVASSFFQTREKWHQFWNVSIIGSLIMSCYGLLQLFGALTIHQGTDRLDATFGNSSYFAIYLVFHIFLCLFFVDQVNVKWQKRAYWFIALFNTFILYFTATRGAILGLIGGLFLVGVVVFFKEKENKVLRKIGKWILVAFLVLIASFFAFRGTNFVKTNFVLSRFSTLSFSEFKTQGRYFVWPMAFKGVADRPVFGWGQENFNFVFNKYYDAHMFGQEEWFDRTHNVLLDWLIAGGIVGFLAYTSMFVALFYYIWRKKSPFLLVEKGLLMGMLAGYIFHNLFVFDNLTSYILFFSVLAYVHSCSTEKDTSDVSSRKTFSESTVLYGFAPAVVVMTLCAIYLINIPALFANWTLIQGITPQKEGPQKNLDLFKQVFSYKSFGSTEAIEQLVTLTSQLVYTAQVPDAVKQGFFNLTKEQVEQKVLETPKDARYLVFAGSFLDKTGQYDEAIKYLDRALIESPQKQSILFELGAAHIAKHEYDKAFEFFKKAYDFNSTPDEVKLVYAVGAIYTKNTAVLKELSLYINSDKVLSDNRFLQAYVGIGDYSTALGILNTRIAKDPTNKQNKLYLASLYASIGQKQRAVDVIQGMIDKDPSFKAEGEGYIKQIQQG